MKRATRLTDVEEATLIHFAGSSTPSNSIRPSAMSDARSRTRVCGCVGVCTGASAERCGERTRADASMRVSVLCRDSLRARVGAWRGVG